MVEYDENHEYRGYTALGHKLRFFRRRKAQFVTVGIIYASMFGGGGIGKARLQIGASPGAIFIFNPSEQPLFGFSRPLPFTHFAFGFSKPGVDLQFDVDGSAGPGWGIELSLDLTDVGRGQIQSL